VRILVVSDVSSYMPGGVPVATRALLRGLATDGHHVALASDYPLSDMDGYPHFPISVPTTKNLSQELARAVSDFSPDFIHVIAMGSRAIVRVVPILKLKPWAFTCHSAPPYERILPLLHDHHRLHYRVRSWRFFASTCTWKWLFRRGVIRHVIVHSRFVRDVVTNYGCPKDNTFLIPLGCETPSSPGSVGSGTASETGPKLLTIGGIAHTKGQLDVIDALWALRREHSGIQYQIVGEVRDSTYYRLLLTRIKELGLEDIVAITTNLTDDQKYDALRSADIYIQPSHEEGFCLAFVEAAAVAMKLIGTDTGAIGLISGSDPGIRVIPVHRPNEISRAIAALLREPVPPDLMEQRVKRLSRDFSWARYVASHESLYTRLVNERH
jgi:glycosyltransferase involved in cell wall biosynthesis